MTALISAEWHPGHWQYYLKWLVLLRANSSSRLYSAIVQSYPLCRRQLARSAFVVKTFLHVRFCRRRLSEDQPFDTLAGVDDVEARDIEFGASVHFLRIHAEDGEA